MPRLPPFPSDEADHEEKAPNPDRIIDRIINGQLRPPLPARRPPADR